MKILNEEIFLKIRQLSGSQIIDKEVCFSINQILSALYNNIPDTKRISYGRVHTLKILTKEVVKELNFQKKELLKFGVDVFHNCEDYMCKGLGLGVISNCTIKDFNIGLDCFEMAASSEQWDLREFTQMFFRMVIKAHPEKAHEFLFEKSLSNDLNTRRFVSETLRPVQENKWMQKNTDYSLSILRNMFKEKAAYPRTSVGNNLSDLAKQNPELILNVCKELVEMKDKNAFWIGNRACRNLVKDYPIKVMNILGVDEYKYKTKIYRRDDY